MKYDERTCKFNMDTGCVELLKNADPEVKAQLRLALLT